MIRVNLNGREWEHIGIGRDLHQTLPIVYYLWRWPERTGNHYIVWVSLYTIRGSILRIDWLCPSWITPVHMAICNLIDISMRGILDKVSRDRMMECGRHINSHLWLRNYASIISEIYSTGVSASKIKLITVQGPIWDTAAEITETMTYQWKILNSK
jgi:hypothetical protein